MSLRAFRDNDRRDEKPILIEAIRLDDPDFAAIVLERARQAAAWDDPAVYCPPVATFKTPRNAKTDNLREGVDLSTSAIRVRRQHAQRSKPCSGRRPASSRAVANGRTRQTGEIEPKVHLHWRLKKPTSTGAEHGLLKRGARRLRPTWSAATAPTSRSSIRSAGPAVASQENSAACEDRRLPTTAK